MITPAGRERLSPVLGGIIVGVCTWGISYLVTVEPPSRSVPAALMTFGIVAAGFAATQRNMLLPMAGSGTIRFAVRTGYYLDIIAYLTDALLSGLLVTVVAVSGLFLPNDCALAWRVWFPCVVAAVGLVVLFMLRNEILMVRVVKRYMRETPEAPEASKQ